MFTNSDTSPAPNVGGTYTKTPSSDIYFEDNMHYALYPPENISFMAKTTKQGKNLPTSANPTLQVGAYITYIDSEGTRVP